MQEDKGKVRREWETHFIKTKDVIDDDTLTCIKKKQNTKLKM